MMADRLGEIVMFYRVVLELMTRLLSSEATIAVGMAVARPLPAPDISGGGAVARPTDRDLGAFLLHLISLKSENRPLSHRQSLEQSLDFGS